MLFTMSQTTRNAPFGTDDTPDMQVKIVGGKRVHIAVDKLKQNQIENKALNQTWPLPRPGPHGTPSILTQPNWEAYDSRVQSRFNTSDQHKLARNVSSYTSPNGDRSHSFKHGASTLNTKLVLPPIATQSADPLTYRRTLSLNEKDIDTPTTLEIQVARELHDFSVQKLKDMYIDLTTFDRELTGMVGEAQLSVVALRHDLPLKLPLLKIIFAKFVDIRDPSMINYEKVLQFLSDCMAQNDTNLPATFLTSRDVDHKRSKTVSPRHSPMKSQIGETPFQNNINHSNKHVDTKSSLEMITGAGQTSPLRPEEEDKLLELILAQLSPKEPLEINELKLSLIELDRSKTGDVPVHAINSACVRHRLPLTSSLITKLLQRAETNSGMADWKVFLEPLERAEKLRRGSNEVTESPTKVTPNFSPSRKSNNPTPYSNPQSASSSSSSTPSLTPQWEKKPLSKIGPGTASVPIYSREPSVAVTKPTFGSVPASPPSTTSSIEREIARLPDGWDEREPLHREDAFVNPGIKTEPWSLKFNKLSHALRTYHPLSKEILGIEEAERITKNYNLIYGLGFSEKRIENAVEQAKIPKKDKSSQQEVSVNALLELLEGKRRLIP